MAAAQSKAMPDAYMRKKMAAALAVMAVSAVFKTAVEEIRSI